MVGAAFFGLSAVTQPGRGGAPGALLRGVQAAGSAGLVAAYLALEFFPGLPLLQVCWAQGCCQGRTNGSSLVGDSRWFAV